MPNENDASERGPLIVTALLTMIMGILFLLSAISMFPIVGFFFALPLIGLSIYLFGRARRPRP
jgi:hypothetical protein